MEYDPKLADLISAGDKDALRAFWDENYTGEIDPILAAKPKVGAKTCRCGKRPKWWVFTKSMGGGPKWPERIVGPYCSYCCNAVEFEPSSH
jgi:hypothetical protein